MKAAVCLGVVLALFSAAAGGQPPTRAQREVARFEFNDQFCRREAYFSKMLMWQRQHDWALTDSLNWMDEELKNHPNRIDTTNKSLYNTIAREAHFYPVSATEAEKQRASNDLEATHYHKCMDALADD